MSKIFLCYRRHDTACVAERLYDRLHGRFGDGSTFIDFDGIAYGENFEQQIQKSLAVCDAVLVLIGPEWLHVTNEEGTRRLDDPGDFVRREIEYSIEHSLPLIPVLVNGTAMPSGEELPPSLRPLAFCQAFQLRLGRDFHRHADDLVYHLERRWHLLPLQGAFPKELVLCPAGAICLSIGALFSLHWLCLDASDELMAADTFFACLVQWVVGGALLLGAAPVLFVFGRRCCCARVDTRSEFQQTPSFKAPKLSNTAVASLALGLSTIGWGILGAIPAIVLGILALIQIQQGSGWIRGRRFAYSGITTALFGMMTWYLALHYSGTFSAIKDFSRVYEANRARDAGQFQLADKLYQDLLDDREDFAAARLGDAISLLYQGKLDESEKRFDVLLHDNNLSVVSSYKPIWADIRFFHSWLAELRGDFETARSDVEMVGRNNKKRFEAFFSDPAPLQFLKPRKSLRELKEQQDVPVPAAPAPPPPAAAPRAGAVPAGA
jgi:hypothetical protein